MGRRLWLDAAGQARVDRRTDRADDRLGGVYQAYRLLSAQSEHECHEEGGLCTHDLGAVMAAAHLLSPSLSPTG